LSYSPADSVALHPGEIARRTHLNCGPD